MSFKKDLQLAAAMLAVTACSELPPAPTSATSTRNSLRLEALTTTSLEGTAGESVSPIPAVRVTNMEGRPMSGIAVSFALLGGGTIARSSTLTDADGSATVGIWTLGSVAGASTVTARIGSGASIAFTAAAKHGPVARVSHVSGNGQMAVAGTILSRPLAVRVTDQYGNAVPRSAVSFTVISGNGGMAGGPALSDAFGVATSGSWTLGGSVGAQQVSAESEGARTEFTAYACEELCSSAQLLFVQDGEIHTTNLLTGDSRLLINGSGRDGHPAWSPDGQRIAFDRDLTKGGQLLGSGMELFLANADGSSVVRRAVGFHSPAWSPDGRWLAVSVNDCIYRCEMYLLKVEDDGSAPLHIASAAAYPAWSPDGTKIAFVSLSGDDGYNELRVMNADGSGLTSITARDEGALFRPSWSPDGRRIAFSKCALGACSIYTVNSDGSALAQLTSAGSSFGPAWSLDGTRIAFTVWDVGVLFVPADGGSSPVLIIPSGHSPAWRP